MEHYNEVEEYVAFYGENMFTTSEEQEEYELEFIEGDVKEVIKKFKFKSATGANGISNKHMVNLPETGSKFVTVITNQS